MKPPRFNRQKRLLLLYKLLQHIGYKVDTRVGYLSGKDKIVTKYLILLNKFSYLTGIQTVKIDHCVDVTLEGIRKEIRSSKKSNYKVLYGRELNSEYIDFMPSLEEHLGEVYGKYPDKKDLSTSKNPLNPLGLEGESAIDSQE